LVGRAGTPSGALGDLVKLIEPASAYSTQSEQ
jgi:hypothetical protein